MAEPSPFRARFLPYDELTAQLFAWSDAHPDLVQVTSIGTTPEGRELWMLTIGPEPERVRPAVWIDGNMHASELCGSSVALAIAEDVIRLHRGERVHDLPDAVIERLRDVLFYVLPRMSPDGAESVLATGKYVRSIPRDERPNMQHPRWICEDIDGDGQALVMRVEDPTGEFVESPEVPNLMLPRQFDDPGPYYKIYPEGRIENFDGRTVPSPDFLSDTQTDLNRNFPFSWAPDHEQEGAGAFPASEPESRAVVEHSTRSPHIFAWLNLHTFGGVFIRPHGEDPDTKMDPEDLALFRELGAWAEELTGYPMVSGFEQFTYEPDKPIRGDLSEYAFHQRGCISYVVELWDLFEQVGLPPKKRFVDRYTHITREEMTAIGRWDRDHNHSRAVRPWTRVDHPQLGAVEVGGIDPRIGLWNPPLERIAEVCDAHSAHFLRVASLAPRVRFRSIETHREADGVTRVDIAVDNTGYLPTYVLASAKKLEISEPLYARAAADGCELLAPEQARHRELGHLDGWGRGRFSGTGALYFTRSRGTTGTAHLTYFTRGTGTLTVTLGSCRVGEITRTIEID